MRWFLPLLAWPLLAASAAAIPAEKPSRLHGIRYYPTVAQAIEKAADRKPIFWLRMLGDLEGKT